MLPMHVTLKAGVRKSRIGFLKLNPKESENVFCVSLLNRSIQDLSDHGASKEPKNPLSEWILHSVPLTPHDPREVGLVCLVKKSKISFRILSGFFGSFDAP